MFETARAMVESRHESENISVCRGWYRWSVYRRRSRFHADH
jgi:hypothetical protein